MRKCGCAQVELFQRSVITATFPRSFALNFCFFVHQTNGAYWHNSSYHAIPGQMAMGNYGTPVKLSTDSFVSELERSFSSL